MQNHLKLNNEILIEKGKRIKNLLTIVPEIEEFEY